MKKSGCLVAFLLVAVCASMFVNLLLLALIGTKGASAMAGVKVLPEKEYDEEVLSEGSDSHSKVAVIPLDGVIGFGMSGSLGDSMVEDFKADFRVEAGFLAAGDFPAVEDNQVSQVSPAEHRLQQFRVVHNLSSWEKFR